MSHTVTVAGRTCGPERATFGEQTLSTSRAAAR